jgi:hypothetical protein
LSTRRRSASIRQADAEDHALIEFGDDHVVAVTFCTWDSSPKSMTIPPIRAGQMRENLDVLPKREPLGETSGSRRKLLYRRVGPGSLHITEIAR